MYALQWLVQSLAVIFGAPLAKAGSTWDPNGLELGGTWDPNGLESGGAWDPNG